MQKIKLLPVLLLVVGSMLWVAPRGVDAQSGAGLRMAPAMFEERVEPGQSYNYTLNITNTSSGEDTLFVIARDIIGASSIGAPDFAPEGEERTELDISTWISFSESSFTLGSNEQKQISFTVAVPEGAAPGGHFAGILVTKQPPQLREIGAAVGYTTASIVSMRVEGDAIEEANIREFLTDKGVYSKPEIGFTTRVQNVGNTLVRPHGLITITNMLGGETASIPVNETGAAVFPETERPYRVTWDPDGLAFGRYQAVVSLAYGEDQRKTISTTASFWVLPMNIIGPVVGGVLVLIVAVVVFAKMLVKKKMEALELAASASGKKVSTKASVQNPPMSKLVYMTIMMLLFSVSFLIVLFFLFG